MNEQLDPIEKVERLRAIATRIRTHHDEAMAAERISSNERDEILHHGNLYQNAQKEMATAILLCGQALIEAKEILGHGEFGPWLVKTGIARSTATRYIQAARSNCSGVSNLAARVKRFTFGLFERWAKRTPELEVVLSLPAEQQQRVYEELEPAERIRVALRERNGE